ncbi:MAG: hypothetical protein NZM25_09310 [Leptospiraceae bacterium]|nr:hypothetical protein [Leptospiraceae bacterium]MDW8307337.1 hypothetical protein [Leptospiraceae bacterium]
MHEDAREEVTSIRIEPDGSWYTGNRKIVNSGVLKYFRTNLHRDKKGVYIYNAFRQLKEKGYISVKGPIDLVVEFNGETFTLSSGIKIPAWEADLAMDSQGNLYIKIPKLELWARFSRELLIELSALIEEKNNAFYFKGKEILLYDTIPWLGSDGF